MYKTVLSTMKNAEKEIMLFEIKNSRTLRKGVGCRNKHAKPRTNNRIKALWCY